MTASFPRVLTMFTTIRPLLCRYFYTSLFFRQSAPFLVTFPSPSVVVITKSIPELDIEITPEPDRKLLLPIMEVAFVILGRRVSRRIHASIRDTAESFSEVTHDDASRKTQQYRHEDS
jgi:hypothetical protein